MLLWDQTCIQDLVQLGLREGGWAWLRSKKQSPAEYTAGLRHIEKDYSHSKL